MENIHEPTRLLLLLLNSYICIQVRVHHNIIIVSISHPAISVYLIRAYLNETVTL